MYNLNQFVMIKKHLLGGALLAAVLVLLTGCNEIMSSLDNPVDSYFKLTEASTTIYRGQSYKIQYSTISDAKPIFKSADEKVAIVDENGVITGVMMGTTKISVTLPATDYYNGASAEFTVEVDGLLKMPLLEKEMAIDETYNLGVTSVSTGAITYKSSNTKVATVDADGNVKAIACGDATITVHIEATPEYDRTEDIDFTAKVRIFDYDQLKALIAANTEVNAIFADNVVITANQTHSWAGKKITLSGNKEKPATIVLTKVFYINDNFKIENVNIDMSGLGNALIKLDNGGSAKTNEQVYTDAAVTGAYYLEEVTLDNVMIKNMKQNLIHTNSRDWALDKLNVTNCIIQLDNDTYPFIQFNSPLKDSNKTAIKNITFKNNTIYNINSNSNLYFIRFANTSNASGMFGTKGGTCTFDYVFENNTIINVSKSQNFGNNTVNNDKAATTMKNNIFVEVKNINKFVQANQAPVLTLENNFISGNATQSADYTEQSKKIGSTTYKWTIAKKLDENPFTIPTEALDLTKKYGGLNLKPSGEAAGAGDPRWNEIN